MKTSIGEMGAQVGISSSSDSPFPTLSQPPLRLTWLSPSTSMAHCSAISRAMRLRSRSVLSRSRSCPSTVLRFLVLLVGFLAYVRDLNGRGRWRRESCSARVCVFQSGKMCKRYWHEVRDTDRSVKVVNGGAGCLFLAAFGGPVDNESTRWIRQRNTSKSDMANPSLGQM